MSQQIDYGNLMHSAMRGLIRTVLQGVADHGLPGSHHFFITFDTRHPDAQLADWLRERYPEEMTVVMQHWYDNLEIDPDGFAVTLNFGDTPEPLYIPFDAIQTFVDPSVEFGLRFESAEDDDEDASVEDIKATDPEKKKSAEKSAAKPDADVVSLDSFRK
ncbi:ClpXP protease specificity-enhancing factor SspB [Phaeobacter sp. PT47_59]|uniref:SspB family protein n=1 Tax=Phaeobacter sp. PT47_59 TaxID=3029979 RepID=UPI00237FDBA9|nr:ClpXP protease specificity-enhancing factor SspB [Phaeobacter sp. PT47_59]MDE4174656.1 ClpXP protease specificity-enhancing factor SspB [Phaeobacter sp. PT47_59]